MTLEDLKKTWIGTNLSNNGYITELTKNLLNMGNYKVGDSYS